MPPCLVETLTFHIIPYNVNEKFGISEFWVLKKFMTRRFYVTIDTFIKKKTFKTKWKLQLSQPGLPTLVSKEGFFSFLVKCSFSSVPR